MEPHQHRTRCAGLIRSGPLVFWHRVEVSKVRCGRRHLCENLGGDEEAGKLEGGFVRRGVLSLALNCL